MSSRTQTKEFNPFSVMLEITSDHNFFYARSSNGYDVYGLLFTGPEAVICSCPAGSRGLNCKHRKALLARYNFITPLDDILDEVSWARLKNRIEDAAERD